MQKKTSKVPNSGFKTLLGVHTQALELNSQEIVDILEVLSEKKLDSKDKKSLQKIKRELRGIDRKVDSLGVSDEEEFYEDSDNWFF